MAASRPRVAAARGSVRAPRACHRRTRRDLRDERSCHSRFARRAAASNSLPTNTRPELGIEFVDARVRRVRRSVDPSPLDVCQDIRRTRDEPLAYSEGVELARTRRREEHGRAEAGGVLVDEGWARRRVRRDAQLIADGGCDRVDERREWSQVRREGGERAVGARHASAKSIGAGSPGRLQSKISAAPWPFSRTRNGKRARANAQKRWANLARPHRAARSPIQQTLPARPKFQPTENMHRRILQRIRLVTMASPTGFEPVLAA